MAMREQPTPEDLRELLERIEGLITELEDIRWFIRELLGEEVVEIPPEGLRNRLIVWEAIHRRGDVVEYNVFKEITRKVGYDPRGIGGFFAGNQPSIIRIGEDKIALARWALDYLERYREWLETMEIP